MKREDVMNEQRYRRAIWPKGRIPFWPKGDSAKRDLRDLELYVTGQIDFRECCRRIARNNYLEWVTVTEVKTFMKETGWEAKNEQCESDGAARS